MLRKANKLLSIVIDWIIGLIMGSIVAILFVGVILRYVFNAPLFWSEELAVLGLIWITFLGGAILTRQDKHVSITILSDMCPRAMGRGMQIIFDVLVVMLYYQIQRLVATLRKKQAFPETEERDKGVMV